MDKFVSPSPGYRLLESDEILRDSPELKEIECWQEDDLFWDDSGWCGNFLEFTYQTKLSKEELKALRESSK